MPAHSFRESDGAYEIVGLRTDALEVTVVPGCGAKIVRLHDRHAGREWIWSARPARVLHQNAVGDAFDDSPLIGIDECLPTVAPCVVDGKEWPDHGEVWPRAWDLDEEALHDARVVTSISLRTVPLSFTRELSVSENTLRLAYTLCNNADEAQRYAWALHPLLAMREGDHIELPPGEHVGRVDSAANLPGLAAGEQAVWPEPLAGVRADRLLPGTELTSLKLYLPSPQPAGFAITNTADGTTMRGRYGPAELLPYLGIWVTRGGWNGYHHFAVEPTNVNDDRADRMDVESNPAAVLGPSERRNWFVELSIGAGER
jgi:hypothetical protein